MFVEDCSEGFSPQPPINRNDTVILADSREAVVVAVVNATHVTVSVDGTHLDVVIASVALKLPCILPECSPPFVMMRGKGGDDCAASCYLPCPFVFWEEGQWDALWYLRFLPSVLSIPLSLLVVASEVSKSILPPASKKGNVLTGGCAFFGMLYSMFDAVPSAVHGVDLSCVDQTVYDYEGTTTGTANRDGHAVCGWTKGSVHLLQALMFTLCLTLYSLYQQLVAASKMKKSKAKTQAQLGGLVAGATVLAGMCLCGTFAFDADPESALKHRYSGVKASPSGEVQDASLFLGNLIRYSHACGPKYDNVAVEMAFVHIPLIVAGTCATILSLMLVRLVLGMRKKSGGSNDALRALAVSMLKFAFVSVICILMYVISTLLFVPRLQETSNLLGRWETCANSGLNPECLDGHEFVFNGEIRPAAIEGEACPLLEDATTVEESEAHCGKWSDMQPNIVLMGAINLSLSLPPLLFGLVFATPAMKTLMKRAKRNMVSSVTSSATSES